MKKAVGISGSIRKGSYNRLLIENAFSLLPPEYEHELIDISKVPLYSQDLEEPASVTEVRLKLSNSDLVFISTPEYNHSYSGVLKNAIDWISRPVEHNPLAGKVVALMSASTGSIGGARAQEHLRVVLEALGAIVVPKPEVIVTNAERKFSADGKLADPVSIKYLSELVEYAIKLSELLRKEERVKLFV